MFVTSLSLNNIIFETNKSDDFEIWYPIADFRSQILFDTESSSIIRLFFPRNGCCFHSIPHRDVGHAFSVTLSDQDPKCRTLKWLFLVRSRAEEKAVMVFGSFYSFYCVFTPRGCRFPFCGLLCQVIFQVLEFQSGLMNDELISGEMSQNH